MTRCHAPSSQRPGESAVSAASRSTRHRPERESTKRSAWCSPDAVLHGRQPDRLAAARGCARGSGPRTRTGVGRARARPAGSTRTRVHRSRRVGPTTPGPPVPDACSTVARRASQCGGTPAAKSVRTVAASALAAAPVGAVDAPGPSLRTRRARARPGPMRPAGGGFPPPVVGCPGTSRSEHDARRCRAGAGGRVAGQVPAASSPACTTTSRTTAVVLTWVHEPPHAPVTVNVTVRVVVAQRDRAGVGDGVGGGAARLLSHVAGVRRCSAGRWSDR